MVRLKQCVKVLQIPLAGHQGQCQPDESIVLADPLPKAPGQVRGAVPGHPEEHHRLVSGGIRLSRGAAPGTLWKVLGQRMIVAHVIQTKQRMGQRMGTDCV